MQQRRGRDEIWTIGQRVYDPTPRYFDPNQARGHVLRGRGRRAARECCSAAHLKHAGLAGAGQPGSGLHERDAARAGPLGTAQEAGQGPRRQAVGPHVERAAAARGPRATIN